jgi:hypothetical protein
LFFYYVVIYNVYFNIMYLINTMTVMLATLLYLYEDVIFYEFIDKTLYVKLEDGKIIIYRDYTESFKIPSNIITIMVVIRIGFYIGK